MTCATHMKMLSMLEMNFYLVIFVIFLGIINTVVSQSPNEPLFNRGCRANRGQFPHETFCQQYYNCWDGRATIEECPGKLLFNPVISACDYPEAVNCGSRLRNPEPAVTADGRCLKQFGIFPDITDCTAFYKCSHGRSYRQICPYYTAFDDRYLVCVHAYEVDCNGRGGVYGTLAPPNFNIPDGGIARIGSGSSSSSSSSSGSSVSGWDRRTSQSSSTSTSDSASGSQATSQGSGTGTGGRRVGPARGSSGSRGSASQGSSGTHGSDGSTSGSGSSQSGGGTSGSSGGTSGGVVSGGAGRGSSGASTGIRGATGSSGGGRGAGGGPSGTSGGVTGTRGGTGSSGTHAGITGVVDKDISATGQERQYERPVSPEATFRCPHPRGLYPNALDCSRFWLCREYKPSLLKCPTGQLFDLASLACTSPEKTQCSSISPRT